MDFCTITTRAGMGAARTLIASLRRHHRNPRVLLCPLDDVRHELDASDAEFELVRPPQLGIARFELLAGIHDRRALTEIVRPALLRTALDRFESVVCLDPTMHAYAPLDELTAGAPLRMLPRLQEPIPADDRRPTDGDVCRLGPLDTGCIAARRDSRVDAMLAVWSERLEGAGERDQEVLEHHWPQLLPSLIPASRLIADPGVGVAPWNTHERRLMHDGEIWRANGEPLRLVNFAGLDRAPDDPWGELLALPAAREQPAALLELHAARGAELGAPPIPYAYDRLADGTPLSPRLRRAIRRASKLGRLRSSPFSVSGTHELLGWLNEPARLGGRAGISRFWLEIYSERPDLQLVHADLDGPGGPGLMAWIEAQGREAYAVPDSLMPSGARR
ncbi:MAG: hypothetical protein NVSMB51_21630 [Solirubrobacteraceae bacterium]